MPAARDPPNPHRAVPYPPHAPLQPLRSVQHRGATLARGALVKFSRTAHSANGTPRTVRSFGLVSRVFADGRRTYVHLHLAKPSQVAGGAELFLQDGRCCTVPLDSSVRGTAGHVVRYVFCPAHGVWRDPLDPSAHTYTPPTSGNGDWDPIAGTACDSCLSRVDAVRRRTPVMHLDEDGAVGGFDFGGEAYHVGDAVFFASNGTTWDIGLLVAQDLRRLESAPRVNRSADGARVAVRLLGRYGDLAGVEGKFVSERRVFLTDHFEARYITDVVAKAAINDPGHPLSLVCTEALPEAGPLAHVDYLRRLNRADRPRCHICAHANANADATDLCLPSIDLYAGGGGSILGAREHFDMRHAVETDPVCIETLRDARNRELYFPNLRVHACPVGELRERGLTPRRAALMFAGPPCQGHSRANHMRNAGDVRNDEIGVTLGEVERLRTAVVVIENVPGIKDPTTDGRNFALDIVARLLALGYQVRVGTVNAAHYGSAQVRHRLFFLAAQRGLPLPPFPRPTHASSLRSTNISIDGKAHSWSHSYSGAAFPMVDAKAAVHDLPLWGYGTRGDGRAYDPAQDGVGVQPARYRSKPLNDFQQRMRQGHGAEELQDHITGRRSERELDLINGAPSARDVDAGVEGTCRRTHPHDQVMTLLTSSRPGGKGTAPIHWACHRTFTVAERKRFTGMPDAYQLHGTPEDKDRLTGNAINVAVAEALAREIKTAVFTKAWREQGKPSSSAFWRSWRAAHPI